MAVRLAAVVSPYLIGIQPYAGYELTDVELLDQTGDGNRMLAGTLPDRTRMVLLAEDVMVLFDHEDHTKPMKMDDWVLTGSARHKALVAEALNAV